MSRPPVLDPLFRSLRSIKGVGPQLSALLNRFFGTEGHDAIALDLLMHMPVGIVDRRRMEGVARTFVGHTATLRLHIDRHVSPPPRGKATRRHVVFAHDETGDIQLVYFGAQGNWVEKLLPVGEERFVSGTIGFFNGTRQMTHPDYVVDVADFDTMPLVEPVYPLTHGLTTKALTKLVRATLDTLPDLPEWIIPERMEQFRWPTFRAAMTGVHAPRDPADAELSGPARHRLAYDEYLAGQLALLIVRSTLVSARGISRSFTGEMTGRVEAALPFQLTPGQRLAIDSVRTDLAAPTRMSRLLQGDVGAGKTVVALMAMAAIAEGGAQSALMAPTELLAAQHFRTLQPLAEKAGLSVALLTGKQSAAERRTIVEGIAYRAVDIVVGTHALFQGAVEFADLGLVVVDEQHRFGVSQRLALTDKGKHADLLVMTATPIPRTLVLTHFGDMAVSVLREKPRGRQPIDTAVTSIGEYDRVVARLKSRIDDGAQAFWVTPLVEESEVLDIVSAEDRFAALRQLFGDRVALVHGRMSAAAKQEVMDRFQANEVKILVATTVIEVGVDVPNATIMIIEHAERCDPRPTRPRS